MIDFLKAIFGSKDKGGLGELATDIRQAIKGQEIDPNELIKSYIEIAKIRNNILQTEMQGNWLQRSWRPLLMLSLVFIVVNNYILFGYFPNVFVQLDLPDHLWELLKVGVGGYVIGRSVEKAATAWKK